MGTSPSAVPAKRSAQGEHREREDKEEEEEEEEEAVGSSPKRKKREGSHMTSEGFSKHQLVSPHVLSLATCSPHHGLH